MGRTPAPAGVKLLKGRRPGVDSGGRKVPEGPEFERGAPAAPIWLTKEARAEWNRVVPEMVRLGVLKRIDTGALVAYCECWSRFATACQIIAEQGMILDADKVGRAQRHPALLTVEAASRELRAWAQEFGLTPSAEARLVSAAKDSDAGAENPFAEAA